MYGIELFFAVVKPFSCYKNVFLWNLKIHIIMSLVVTLSHFTVVCKFTTHFSNIVLRLSSSV
jgi:hypothetical protein